MKKSKEYNIIIYTCLLLAIVLLVLGGRDYLKDLNKPVDKEKTAEVVDNDENIDRKEDNKKEQEPQELQSVDKQGIVKKYLDSLVDQIKKDKKIPYKTIKTWGKYEVGEVEYQRKITANYYEYKANINIPNKKATLPCKPNEELSTEEYTVITIYVDITDSDLQNGYVIKNIDLIEES